jgi:twitching motility protein PilT
MNFEGLLKFGVDQGASAIHLQAESSPQLRIGGLIRNVEGPLLKAEDLEAFLKSIVPKSGIEQLDQSRAPMSSFSTSVSGAGRFRCTNYSHVGGPGLVLRVIPSTIRSVEELHLPPVVRQVALAPQGLVLVVGPAGSGKTTTLAAMVDAINGASHRKIVTVEAPVEYLYANKKSLITQMEVGRDVSSFEHGLELALEQDADVIVIGDLRDPAVARRALGAAEAGRKILAAMTGLYAIPTVARFLAMIPPEEREMAVSQLASSLEGLIAQRLARTREGKLQAAVEILRGGANTSKAILGNRLKDLGFYMEGRQGGMLTLDQHLIELYQAGTISGTEAMRLAVNPEAVGAGLRAPQQVKATSDGAASDLSPDDSDLLP